MADDKTTRFIERQAHLTKNDINQGMKNGNGNTQKWRGEMKVYLALIEMARSLFWRLQTEDGDGRKVYMNLGAYTAVKFSAQKNRLRYMLTMAWNICYVAVLLVMS